MTKLEQHKDGGVLVLRPVGSLDQDGVFQISTAFAEAAAGSGRVVVDLSAVQYIATPAIALLLGTHRTLAQQHGRMVVTGAQGMIADILHRCRLDLVLTMAPTVRDAVEWAKTTGVGG